MKKLMAIILCTALLLAGTNTIFATEQGDEYSVLDGACVRLLGRGEVNEDGSRTFNWPNAGFEFEFSGTAAQVFVDEAKQDNSAYNGSYFSVDVYSGDQLVRTGRIKLESGWNTVYTYQNGDPDLKKIMITRSSEACKGTVRISLLKCDAQPQATKARTRRIEFIGDSYTAGFGNSPHLSEAPGYTAQNTDNHNSYTGYVARHYNADNTVIAYMGKGVYANQKTHSPNNLEHTMSHQFNYSEIYTDTDADLNMSTGAKHDFSTYQPHLVTVWLGTNDIAAQVPVETFKTAYIKLIEDIRSKYPDAVILCMSIPRNNMYYNTIASVVSNEAGGAANKVYFHAVDKFSASGIDSHPTAEEHKAIADELIATIDSIPGVWEESRDDDTTLISLRADYNTGKVTVFGNTGRADEHISALVLKAETQHETSDEGDAEYIGQVTTNAVGDYQFSFLVDRICGEYSFYMNSFEMDSMQEKNFKFTNLIPTMLVEEDGVAVKGMKQLEAGDTLTVTLSGFEAKTGFKGTLAVIQFSGDKMKAIKAFNASGDSRDFGTEIVKTVQVAESCDKIKVIYMNQSNLSPLIGVYNID